MQHGKQLIGGHWTEGRGRAVRSILNPATLEVLATVPDAGPADVGDAVDAARKAQRTWAAMSCHRRRLCVAELGARVRAAADELAELITHESGMPLRESREWVDGIIAGIEAATAADSDDAPAQGVGARGLVAALPSEREALPQLVRMAVPALIDGCAVIVKPPVHHPLSSLLFAAFHDSLPAGVMNVVTGAEEVASALRQCPDVRCAATGESEGTAAFHPVLVLDDADLDLAVRAVAWSRLRHSGQAGDAAGPILVSPSIAAEFAGRLHEFLAFLEVGDPMRPGTDLGPLVSREAALRAERQVARAAKAGARLVLGGRCYQPWGLQGHFFQPTLLTGLHPQNPAYRERVAGPVLALTPVAGTDEALELARDLRPAGVALHGGGENPCAPDLAFTHITARDSRWFPYAPG